MNTCYLPSILFLGIHPRKVFHRKQVSEEFIVAFLVVTSNSKQLKCLSEIEYILVYAFSGILQYEEE
jgi:hypothetical protein